MITCVSDEETFTADVYNHLYEQLEKQSHFEQGKDIVVTPELVRLDADNNQIHVDATSHVPRQMIKRILESYLKSSTSRINNYGVIEIVDTFNISIMLNPTK